MDFVWKLYGNTYAVHVTVAYEPRKSVLPHWIQLYRPPCNLAAANAYPQVDTSTRPGKLRTIDPTANIICWQTARAREAWYNCVGCRRSSVTRDFLLFFWSFFLSIIDNIIIQRYNTQTIGTSRHVNATRSYLHFRQNWVFYW